MNIYIVVTYYHLLISIIKNIKNKGNNDLIIYGDTKDNNIIDNATVINKLKKSKIFRNMYVIDRRSDFVGYKDYSFGYQLKRIFVINNLKRYLLNKVQLDMYDNIVIFNDITSIGKCINKMKLKYILLEDGLDCYKNNKKIVEIKNPIKKIVKKFLYGSYQLGESKNIKYIEVNCAEGVFLKGKKIIENNKMQMFNALSTKEKKEIFDLFINEKFDYSRCYNLLITQPLFQDGIVKSEEKQISVYKKIISEYCNSSKVIIKCHPREDIDYMSAFVNVILLNGNFPLEVLTLNDNIKFKNVITISSTSIDMIKNCENKIRLDWSWLEQYEKER